MKQWKWTNPSLAIGHAPVALLRVIVAETGFTTYNAKQEGLNLSRDLNTRNAMSFDVYVKYLNMMGYDVTLEVVQRKVRKQSPSSQ